MQQVDAVHHDRGERGMKLVLMTIFCSTIAYLGTNYTLELTPFEWIMLGLAVLRMGRMLAFELVMEPVRSLFAVTMVHADAGMTTEPRYLSGWRMSIGQLLTCPICAGTWSALVLIAGLIFLPGVFNLLIKLLSVVSVAELSHELIESLCWAAAAHRKQS